MHGGRNLQAKSYTPGLLATTQEGGAGTEPALPKMTWRPLLGPSSHWVAIMSSRTVQARYLLLPLGCGQQPRGVALLPHCEPVDARRIMSLHRGGGVVFNDFFNTTCIELLIFLWQTIFYYDLITATAVVPLVGCFLCFFYLSGILAWKILAYILE